MRACSSCGKTLVPGARFCPGCGAALVAHAMPKKPALWIVLAGLVFLVALGAYSGFRDASPTAQEVVFDVHDPLAFQQRCGDAAWRKMNTLADGTPHALTIFYGTPSFGIGQLGVMVLFSDSPTTNPLDFHDVTFFSVPSNRVVDQTTALKMIGCVR